MKITFKSDDSGIRKLETKLRKLENTREVSLTDLLTTGFLRQYTSFSSLEDMLENEECPLTDDKELSEIPLESLDGFAKKHTSFSSWSEMIDKALDVWIGKQLRF